MANHLRIELVPEALNMAIWQRRPESVLVSRYREPFPLLRDATVRLPRLPYAPGTMQGRGRTLAGDSLHSRYGRAGAVSPFRRTLARRQAHGARRSQDGSRGGRRRALHGVPTVAPRGLTRNTGGDRWRHRARCAGVRAAARGRAARGLQADLRYGAARHHRLPLRRRRLGRLAIGERAAHRCGGAPRLCWRFADLKCSKPGRWLSPAMPARTLRRP